MVQLDAELRSMGMHRVGQRADAGDVAIFGDRFLTPVARPLAIADRHRSHGDQRRAALGPLGIIGADALAGDTVLVCQIRPHRGHEDAVAQLEHADSPGRQQMLVAVGHAYLSARASRGSPPQPSKCCARITEMPPVWSA